MSSIAHNALFMTARDQPRVEGSRIAISTTIWGVFLALITLVAWYVFSAKAARIEQMRLK